MLRNRYLRILWFFARVLLNILFWDLVLARLGLGQFGKRNRSKRLTQISISYRTLAIQMGGVLIKMGQFLSSRMDVLPPEITRELAGLQDEVTPEPFEHVRQVLEQEFGQPLESRFISFETPALASASIGQVHRARIQVESHTNGQVGGSEMAVVVKVQRPDIARIVDVDLAALRVVGGWVNLYRPISQRVNIRSLLDEFSRSLHEEIDYLLEGKNAETFAENFAGVANVKVPHIFWSHTTRRVLTLEDVLAIKITDYDEIETAGINRGEVANRLFNVYLKQIFEDRFFHADPHPGNLFILPVGEKDEAGKRDFTIVFVDFGMVGRVPPGAFAGLRELFIGVGTQDAARVIKAYQMLDILLPGADTNLLEKATTRVFERFWGKTAPEVLDMHQEEAREFLDEFGELIYEMPFQVPEHLILFGRCLAILSGMCTGLDHEFNIFSNLQPYANKLINQDGDSRVNTIYKELVNYLTLLSTLPRKTDSILKRLDQGQLEVRSPLIEARLAQVNRSMNLLISVLIFTTLFVSGIQLFLNGFQQMGFVVSGAGIVFLLGSYIRNKKR